MVTVVYLVLFNLHTGFFFAPFVNRWAHSGIKVVEIKCFSFLCVVTHFGFSLCRLRLAIFDPFWGMVGMISVCMCFGEVWF